MGRPEDTQGLPVSHPQSLAAPEDEFVDDAVVRWKNNETWKDRLKRRTSCLKTKGCRKYLIGVVLLVLATGLVTGIVMGVQNQASILSFRHTVVMPP